MRDDENWADDEQEDPQGLSVSRRDFLKVGGISLSVPLVLDPKTLRLAGADVKVYGPGKVPISLNINKKKYTAEVEPRVTLLDTLRNGKSATFIVFQTPEEGIGIPVDLKGFGEAYDALPK